MRQKYLYEAEPSRVLVPAIPRTGPWSGDNQLGSLAKYGPDRRGRQTILKLDEWGPPDVWTLSLFLTQTFRTFNGFGITAEINFGVGGGTQTVEIDWVNGAQISLPLNAVNVVAKFQDVDVAAEGSGLALGVQLARGPRAGLELPRLTLLENFTIANTVTTAPLRLPAFAKNLIFVPSTMSTANVGSVFNAAALITTISGNDAGAFNVETLDGTRMALGRKLPVTGQARFWQMAQATGGPIDVTVYAEIDG